MPNRIIREAILTSTSVCSLAWPDEVFYRRLMSIVDDYGRHEANPQLLRSRCYPLQTDQVRVADISRWMAACQKAGLVVLYEMAGKQYLQIEKFGQQLRSASKCPSPPAADINCDQPLATAPVFVFGVGGEGVVGGKPAASSSPGTATVDEPCPHRRLLALFAEKLPELPKPRAELWEASAGSEAMRQRWRWLLSADAVREGGTRYATTADEAVEWFGRFFERVAASDFLTGRSGKWSGCNLAWLMKRENFRKVVEGQYDDTEAAA